MPPVGNIWRENGKGPITDKFGRAVVCDECPCGGCTLCQHIRERQQAYPAAGAGLLDCLVSHTLAEYKDIVNYIAPRFLDGTWSAGASAPQYLTNTYANSATTADELKALVADMITTWVDIKGKDKYVYKGDSDTWEHATAAAAFASAQANYAQSSYDAGYQGIYGVHCGSVTHKEAENEWGCEIETKLMTPYLDGIFADIDKTARLALLSGTYGGYSPFDKQGRTMANYDIWWVEDTQVLGSDTEVDFSDFSGSGMAINFTDSDSLHQFGYGVGGAAAYGVVLLDWDFECV